MSNFQDLDNQQQQQQEQQLEQLNEIDFIGDLISNEDVKDFIDNLNNVLLKYNINDDFKECMVWFRYSFLLRMLFVSYLKNTMDEDELFNFFNYNIFENTKIYKKIFKKETQPNDNQTFINYILFNKDIINLLNLYNHYKDLFNLSLLKNPLAENLNINTSNKENIMYSWEDETLTLYHIDNAKNKTRLVYDINDIFKNIKYDDYRYYFGENCLYQNKYNKNKLINECPDAFKNFYEVNNEFNKEKIIYYYRLLINLGFKENFDNNTLNFDITTEKFYDKSSDGLIQNENIKILNNLKKMLDDDKKYKHLEQIIVHVNKALSEVFNKKLVNEKNLKSSNYSIPRKIHTDNYNKINNPFIGGTKLDLDVIQKNLQFITTLTDFLTKNNYKLDTKISDINSDINKNIESLKNKMNEYNTMINHNNILKSYAVQEDLLMDDLLKDKIINYIEQLKHKYKILVKKSTDFKKDLMDKLESYLPNIVYMIMPTLRNFV